MNSKGINLQDFKRIKIINQAQVNLASISNLKLESMQIMEPLSMSTQERKLEIWFWNIQWSLMVKINQDKIFQELSISG